MIYQSLGRYCGRELVLGCVGVLLRTITLRSAKAFEHLQRVACQNCRAHSTKSDLKLHNTQNRQRFQFWTADLLSRLACSFKSWELESGTALAIESTRDYYVVNSTLYTYLDSYCDHGQIDTQELYVSSFSNVEYAH
jgi:hypothetical protein